MSLLGDQVLLKSVLKSCQQGLWNFAEYYKTREISNKWSESYLKYRKHRISINAFDSKHINYYIQNLRRINFGIFDFFIFIDD